MSILASKAFHCVLGFGVSIGLILWIFLIGDWTAVWSALQGIHYFYFIPSLLVLLLHFLLRAWRWRYLLPPDKSASYRSLFDAILLGAFATFLLPLRAGEFVRPYFLAKESEVSFPVGFSSVVVERFFDLSTVLATFGILVYYVPTMPDWAYAGAWALSALAIGIFVFIIVGSFFPDMVSRIFNRIFQLLPDKIGSLLGKFVRELLEGASVLAHPVNLLRVVVLSLAVWMSCYLLFYSMLFLFDIEVTVWLAVSAAVIVALAVAAPSAPGFIGVYQTGCLAAFALFGIDTDVAIAYSLVSHALQFVVFVLYGLFILYNRQISFSDLRQPATSS